MTRVNKQLLPVIALAALMAVGTVIDTKRNTAQAAGSAPVTIVGPSPLPVSLQGTGSISGNVNANITNTTVPVSGTVAVSSLPAVTLGGTPTVNAHVTDSTPLSVQEVFNPAALPFNMKLCDSNFGECSPSLTNTFTVPTTVGGISVKRLVIEYVSASCSVTPSDGAVLEFSVSVNVGSGGPVYDFTPFTVLTTSSGSTFRYQSVAGVTRIYANPGDVILAAVQGFTGGTNYACDPEAVSGYYLPQ